MFEILERSSGSVLGIRVSGKATAADYERVIPEIRRVIDEHGHLDLLCRFEGFSGMEWEALWKDLELSARHFSDVSRCAIVKDREWQGALGRLGGLFGIDVRIFEPSEEEAAWEWLSSAVDAGSEWDAERRAAHQAERRSRATRLRLDALVTDLRKDVHQLEDPRAQALFEASAEVIDGVRSAFRHFEKRSEAAWREGVESRK